MPTFTPTPALSGALSRMARRPARFILVVFVILSTTVLFLFWSRDPPPPRIPFYDWQPRALFPPLSPTAVENSNADFCSNFPSHLLDRIQIVLRTGSGEHERIASQLTTVSSCIHNLIVVSDLEERRGKHDFIDVLADLPQSYRVDNPDFDAYALQKAAAQAGEEMQYTGEGWKLDKFKFLPMVEKAHALKPNAEWYIFIETDSYIFWDTMFRLLSQYDPTDQHLIGAPVAGSKAGHFPYGGAGFVMSKGLMKKYLRPSIFDRSIPSEQYEQWAREECCGDIILANVIYDRTGVTMKRLWPTFNGEEFIKVQVDRRTWCVPLLAMHRLSSQQMNDTWHWERTRYDDQKPVLHSTLLYHRQGKLFEESTRDFWDNLSDTDSPNGLGHTSSVACRVACENDFNCFQWSYTMRRCRFGWGIKYGHAVEDKREHFLSGWDIKKIKKMGFDFREEGATGCEKATWETPETY
ncbi:hypothetical protein EJ05DRAFT_499303 [Pseudovirgaria hyperparasitica]|uniref:N-acetylgalactosaminide beta-1,3-galactosyltransferase n=1 Tax=Pseudovirgaria hyperparasitica TaxID=470096 RepID=A0A6A6WB82_9PEZI|nr:uncharacterized protein EJ05DRAFT_499303 [Pseudovirgaria hyperparasitica]KAF2758867.1 hypothetical protein EJ05DRAFT_499303 [Pseudovirgaria hyperparasitica]